VVCAGIAAESGVGVVAGRSVTPAAMKGGPRVCWIHRSPVFHHARYHQTPAGLAVPCGTVVHSQLSRAQEGNAATAISLGLRPCCRCFPLRATH